MRLGEIEAFVDTGAGISIVSADLIKNRSSFIAEKSLRSLWDIGCAQIHSEGEIKMLVKYAGKVVDLNVMVVPGSACPLLLGRDWIEATRAAITWNGKSYKVDVRDEDVQQAFQTADLSPNREKSRSEELSDGQGGTFAEPDLLELASTEMCGSFEAPRNDERDRQDRNVKNSKGLITSLNCHVPSCQPAVIKTIPPESRILVRAAPPQSNSDQYYVRESSRERNDRECYASSSRIGSVNAGGVRVPIANNRAFKSRRTKFKLSLNQVKWRSPLSEGKRARWIYSAGCGIGRYGWKKIHLKTIRVSTFFFLLSIDCLCH